MNCYKEIPGPFTTATILRMLLGDCVPIKLCSHLRAVSLELQRINSYSSSCKIVCRENIIGNEKIKTLKASCILCS